VEAAPNPPITPARRWSRTRRRRDRKRSREGRARSQGFAGRSDGQNVACGDEHPVVAEMAPQGSQKTNRKTALPYCSATLSPGSARNARWGVRGAPAHLQRLCLCLAVEFPFVGAEASDN